MIETDADRRTYLRDLGDTVSFTLADNTVINAGADGKPLLGLFNQASVISALGGFEVNTAKFILTCIEIDVAEVKKADKVLIRNKIYGVLKNPVSCLSGFALIDLAP